MLSFLRYGWESQHPKLRPKVYLLLLLCFNVNILRLPYELYISMHVVVGYGGKAEAPCGVCDLINKVLK